LQDTLHVMAQNQQNLQASILDRLLDDNPELSQEPVHLRLLNISQAKASVIRDLEKLLNTRRVIVDVPDSLKELGESLFTYGLRDYTALNPRSVAVRQSLLRDIEATILRFEPRLQNVAVRLEKSNESERNLRFRISALLLMEPVAEPVTFDTYFDASKGQYVVTE
jgi:type VI secretion system protein ImpF